MDSKKVAKKRRDSGSSHEQEIDEIQQQSTVDKKVRVMPKKADFRMHAHCNPLIETYFPFPLNPDYVDWGVAYPKHFGLNQECFDKIFLNTLEHPIVYIDKVNDTRNGKLGRSVDFLDIGCGFGGLIFALAAAFKDHLVMGMEIRGKVVNFVGEKIRALRSETNYTQYMNASVVRTNTMKHLVQYFRKASLSKIFILFPDPNFKKRNHRRRIVNQGLLSEYAYVLKPKGRIYCITDVSDLHDWHVHHLQQHKMIQFEKVPEVELEDDVCAKLIWNSTEEGQKVERNKGQKFSVIYQRIDEQ